MSDVDEAFAAIGRELVGQLTDSLDSHVDSAETKLNDDDLIAFGLVCMRWTDEHGVETVSQRAIDPAFVADSPRDPEVVIDAIHDGLCETWDAEVAEHE